MVVDDQTLLVGQMQQADEAIRGGDIRHGLLRVYGLQIVDDVREGKGAINGFGGDVVDCGCLGRGGDLRRVISMDVEHQ